MEATKGGLPISKPKSEIIESDQFLGEYTDGLVAVWDDYIDWDARKKAEDEFFVDVLRAHGAEKVLDAACGTGYHAVQLSRAGFDVEASDGSPVMVRKARENAERYGEGDLDVRVADWTALSEVFEPSAFDAVVCLGNSFTHLHGEAAQKAALAGMASVLRDDGVLVIDQRNYDRLLDKGADSGHGSYYSGDAVNGVIAEAREDLVRFECVTESGEAFDLNLNPVRQDALTALLEDTGFEVLDRYGDFQTPFEKYAPDFVVQVAAKRAAGAREAGSTSTDHARSSRS